MFFLKSFVILFISLVLSSLVLYQFSKSADTKVQEPQDPTTCTLYKWYDPNTNDKEAKHFLKNCAGCHMAYYKEWINDRHSMSQNNPFFLSIYSGTDKRNNRNIYPGFRLDHPKQNGNCALCHNPEAALDNNYNIDLRVVKNTNGISCNFCHKIESVDTNPLKQGVRGLTVPRKCKGLKDIGFGPLDDLIESTDIVEFLYNPIYKKSLYCAKCHDGFQGNTRIYSTFTEWLESPARKKGIQCQSCHMPLREVKQIGIFRYGSKKHLVDNPDVKSKLRPFDEFHSHSFLTSDPHEFRKKHVDLKINAKIKNNILKVTCKVSNKNTGHDFPTGSPMRNAVLVLDVKCKDSRGVITSPLQVKGSRLPSYAGELKDKPGKLFAKILEETSALYATQHGKEGIAFRKTANKLGIPAQGWWNVYISTDTRIKAGKEDVSVYEFELPDDVCRVEVTSTLRWRNTWPGLVKLKGFELKEDIVREETISLNY